MNITRQKINAERSYLVVKSNSIIQKAIYDLSALDLKVLFRILQKIKPEQTNLEAIEFDIKEFCQLCGIDKYNGSNFSNIRDSIQNLKEKTVWIPLTDSMSHPILDKAGKPVIQTFSWINKAIIFTGEAKVMVYLDSALEKHLLNLTSLFTVLDVLYIFPMQSKYSIRLYELLRSYANIKLVNLSLSELHDKTTQSYPNWNHFHQKIIKPALKEINLHTELIVNYKPKKTGRKITSIDFSIFMKNEFETNVVKQKNKYLLNEK